jgi:ATP-dependent 26S proteasome regulatory subunit
MRLFANPAEHLLAELERVDLLIRARVARLRRLQGQDEHFKGLYISEQEVDRLLAQPLGRPQWLAGADTRWLADVDERLQALARAIEQRRAATVKAGRRLPLDELRHTFALTALDVDVLLVALAVELDLRYERLYAYLQDDVTRKRPSVELALHLLAADPADGLLARERFHASAPLIAHRIVQLLDDASQPSPPLLARYLKPDPRVVQFLLGSDEIDIALRGAVQAVASGRGLDELPMDAPTRQACRQAGPPAENGSPAPVLLLHGRAGSGRRSLAQALCRERGLPLLVVDVGRLAALEASAGDWAGLLGRVEREAMLRGAALYWHGLESLGDDPTPARHAELVRAIDGGGVTALIGLDTPLDAGTAFPRRGAVSFTLPEPDRATRRATWAAGLDGRTLEDTVDLDAVAARFRLNPGQIAAAAATAGHVAHQRGSASIAQRDLFEACRRHSSQRLGALARKVSCKHRWSDIVLAPDRMEQLREICNQVRFRDLVYGEWGFGRKLSQGRGLAVLFAGPSGTGKTMAAAVLAAELELDLYKIDLSTIVSKYIGETEKNLSRVFDEAESSNAILFFDEADALFGKRSEVRDSHDRYANIEVGYLLQRIEEYEGVAIMATNIRKNMDDAFLRRLHFTVEFEAPDAQRRLAIWRSVWPEGVPREAGLDFESLAERYELNGGHIRNAALAAAFFAADEKERLVRRGHVLRAIRREYEKSGKLLDEREDEAAPAADSLPDRRPA